MKFSRYPRYEPQSMSNRKVLAFQRKQEKERARYPLLADHVATEQHSLETEIERRTNRLNSIEAKMRANCAASWRRGRARYFSLDEATKSAIRDKWEKWTGPRTSTYFFWVVDTLSGDQAARVAEGEKMRRAIRAKLPREAFQTPGDLF